MLNYSTTVFKLDQVLPCGCAKRCVHRFLIATLPRDIKRRFPATQNDTAPRHYYADMPIGA